MLRRALLVLTLAGLYIAVKQLKGKQTTVATDRAAEDEWANEGGATQPASV